MILLKEVHDKNPFIAVDIEAENKEWAALADMVATKAVATNYWKCTIKLTGWSV